MAETVIEAERAGSRWYNSAPSEDAVKEWFETQPLHEGMQHGPYMGGIVLIPAKEEFRQTRHKQNGEAYVATGERAVFTPYIKVDTRIAYFWNYVRHLNGGNLVGDLIGRIEPVEQTIISRPEDPYRNDYLPTGFSVVAAKESAGGQGVARFLVCTMRVAIYERQSYADRVKGNADVPLLEGIDSKQSTLLKRNGYADENVIMKARTGAVGRALGVAGMLVVGTGVATAEEMQDFASGETVAGASGPEAAVLPEAVGGGPEGAAVADAAPPSQAAAEGPESDEELRQRGEALAEQLRAFPGGFEDYSAWYQERQFPPFATLTGSALKGAVVKLERSLDDARRAASGE